jgi:ABC-type sugar transport system substrate-binding protein
VGILYRRFLPLIGVLVVSALALAACGGGGSSSSESSTTAAQTGTETESEPASEGEGENETASSESAGEFEAPLNEAGAGELIPANLPPSGLARAEAGFEQFSKPQPKIPVTQPIGKEVPSGMNIAYMSCGLPECKTLFEDTQEAAKVLGWTAKEINAGFTPETISKAWEQVVLEEPDAVITLGYSRALFASSLSQLESKEIPVVDCCVAEPPGEGIIEVINWGPQGAQMAWAVVHDSKGKPTHYLWVNDKEFPIINEITQVEFKSEIEKSSPESSVETMEAPTTSFGTTLPGEIVSFLRTHSDIEYVVLGEGAMSTGLGQALHTANIKIPVADLGATPAQLKAVKDGEETTAVVNDGPAGTAQLIDVLARQLAGAPPSNSPAPFTGIRTPENIEDPSAQQIIYPNALQQYEKLWGK